MKRDTHAAILPGDDSDAPGCRDRRWAASVRERSDRVTGGFSDNSEKSVYPQPIRFSALDCHSLEKNSAGLDGCGVPSKCSSAAFEVIAVGRGFSGGRKSCCPKNLDQRHRLEKRSSSEGGA